MTKQPNDLFKCELCKKTNLLNWQVEAYYIASNNRLIHYNRNENEFEDCENHVCYACMAALNQRIRNND